MRIAFGRKYLPLHLWAMKDEITTEQKKQWARLLYIYHEETIQNIAAIVNIDESEVRLWVHDNKWTDVKRSNLTSKENQLQTMYSILEKATDRMKNDENPNPKDADLLIKYTAAIKNLETDTSLTQIVEVAKLFTTWLYRRDIPLTKTVTLQLDAFIKERLAA